MDTAQALEWIAKVFAIQGRELRLEDTRATVGEWDSLGDLLLLSTLEEELAIVVSADDVAAMDSIRDILALLDARGAFSAA
jgi:acyl carrier protein